MRSILTFLTCSIVLSGCGSMGQFFPDFEPLNNGAGVGMQSPMQSKSMQAGSPVRPETLVECRGHVLVPAIGMTFVPSGASPPSSGQYLREESLTPPYRVFPPGASGSMDYVAARLNLDLDDSNSIVGLRCG